jgi:hypothetical protein
MFKCSKENKTQKTKNMTDLHYYDSDDFDSDDESLIDLSKIVQIIQNPHHPADSRQEHFQKLCQLLQDDSFRIKLCEEKINFFPMIYSFLMDPPTPMFLSLSTICLWYLSRNVEASNHICRPEYQLLPLLRNYLYENAQIKPNIIKCFSNISLNASTHNYLFANEINFLEFCYHEIELSILSTHSYQTLGCIALSIQPDYRYHLLKFPFIQLFFQNLITVGSNPRRWLPRFYGPHYWCLNYLSTITSWKNNDEILKILFSDLKGVFPFQFFYELTKTKQIESIKALFILSKYYHFHQQETRNIISSSSSSSSSSCSSPDYCYEFQCLSTVLTAAEQTASDPHQTNYYTNHSLGQKLLDIYYILLSGESSATSTIYESLSNIGFAYGILKLRDIASTLAALSCFPENCQVLLSQSYWERLFPLLTKTIQLFIDNEGECTAFGSVAKEYSGGGGQDFESMEYLLILLMNLVNHEMNERNRQHEEAKQKVKENQNITNEGKGHKEGGQNNIWRAKQEEEDEKEEESRLEFLENERKKKQRIDWKRLMDLCLQIVHLPEERQNPTEITILAELVTKKITQSNASAQFFLQLLL